MNISNLINFTKASRAYGPLKHKYVYIMCLLTVKIAYIAAKGKVRDHVQGSVVTHLTRKIHILKSAVEFKLPPQRKNGKADTGEDEYICKTIS